MHARRILAWSLVVAVAATIAWRIIDRSAESRPSARDEPILVKVLAIDGGGARGLIPAIVLQEIEARTGERIHQLFDVIAGTSTGSLITAMLTVPKPDSDEIRTAAEIVDFYQGPGARRFFEPDPNEAGGARALYPASSHIAGIKGAISATAMLSEARAHVTITSYNLVEQPPRTYTFTRWKARCGRLPDSPPADNEFRMWEVIRAASTYPGIWPGFTLESVSGKTYYPLDGGMFAINPVVEGVAHSIRLMTRMELDGTRYRFLVVSLGTGHYNQTNLMGSATQTWGPADWFAPSAEFPVPPITEVLFDGQTGASDSLMDEISGPSNRVQHYYRFQPEMTADFKLDDTSAEALATLRGYAETMLAARRPDLDTIVDLLAGGKGLPDRPLGEGGQCGPE